MSHPNPSILHAVGRVFGGSSPVDYKNRRDDHEQDDEKHDQYYQVIVLLQKEARQTDADLRVRGPVGISVFFVVRFRRGIGSEDRSRGIHDFLYEGIGRGRAALYKSPAPPPLTAGRPVIRFDFDEQGFDLRLVSRFPSFFDFDSSQFLVSFFSLPPPPQ